MQQGRGNDHMLVQTTAFFFQLICKQQCNFCNTSAMLFDTIRHIEDNIQCHRTFFQSRYLNFRQAVCQQIVFFRGIHIQKYPLITNRDFNGLRSNLRQSTPKPPLPFPGKDVMPQTVSDQRRMPPLSQKKRVQNITITSLKNSRQFYYCLRPYQGDIDRMDKKNHLYYL